MANWQAIVGLTTYNLSGRNPYDVVSVSGVGVAPVRRLTQRGPLQHGETDVGYRYDSRSINLVLAFNASSRAVADQARDTLAIIFRATGTPIRLRCTRDDGAVRQIDCYATGLVDWPINEQDRIWTYQRIGVQLVAPDPLWYDPTVANTLVVGPPEDWYLAGGLIDEGDVVTNDSGISERTAWSNAEGALSRFSVVARTRRSYVSGQNRFAWWASGGTPGVRGSAGGYSGSVDRVHVQDVGGTTLVGGSAPDDELHIYGWDVGSAGDGNKARMWLDDSNLFNVPTGAPETFDPLGVSGWWGGQDSDGTFYGQALTHVAIYSVPLTSGIMAALETILNENQTNFENEGNADAFPIVTLIGPLTNPVVTNNTTGEVLSLTGTIASGDYLTIDLAYGAKTIIDNTGANQIALLDSDSDLATWHLAPGDNLISIEADGGLSGIVNLAWYNRYVGL